MPESLFQTLDIEHLRTAMAKIHAQVAQSHGRVELTRAGSEDACVILSKAELQCLEQALEILADTPQYRSMSQNLNRLAAECGSCATPVGELLYPEG